MLQCFFIFKTTTTSQACSDSVDFSHYIHSSVSVSLRDLSFDLYATTPRIRPQMETGNFNSEVSHKFFPISRNLMSLLHCLVRLGRYCVGLATGDCRFNPSYCAVKSDLGQVVRTHLPPSASSIFGSSIS